MAAERRRKSTTAALAAGLTLAATLVATHAARAQNAALADVWRGKSLNVLIGVGVGGEYDLHARLVARHIGRHIPGQPAVVPQNMTGAGGVKMVAYLLQVAPKDGLTIGMIPNNFVAMQAVGAAAIRFDMRQLQWIGSISPTVETMVAWKTAGVSSIDDVRRKEIIAGASGKGAITYSFPQMLNEILGTKFRIVPGYTGGNAINLAMERGEVQARNNTWSSWKVTKPEWLRDGDIKVLVYAGPKPRDLNGVPSATELARTDDDRKIIELVVSGARLGRPLAANGAPPERLEALRAAFDATILDKDFIADANKLQIDIEPVRGADMQKVVDDVLATPKHLAERARSMVE